MKIPTYISFAGVGLSLVLGVVVLIVGTGNYRLNADNVRLQQELRRGEEQIDFGNSLSRKLGMGHLVVPPVSSIGSHPPSMLQDMAIASIKDEKMRALLKKHGYSVATPTPAPGLPE